MLFQWFQRVESYTVHECPDPVIFRDKRADELVFVKDGFSLLAILLPPIWMLINRLWLIFAGYISSIFILCLFIIILDISSFLLAYFVFGLNLIIGFEADSLVRWTLNRRGWKQIAHITGLTIEECERRFYSYWLHSVSEASTTGLMPKELVGNTKLSTMDDQTVSRTSKIKDPKRRIWSGAINWRR
ncbi:MAG: hypothetical protein TECD_00311 [Hyphomicrobiaceae bacterium hypho_1]